MNLESLLRHIKSVLGLAILLSVSALSYAKPQM